MTCKITIRLALVALLCCSTAGAAQVATSESGVGLPWTATIALDPSDGDRGSTLTISLPPPDAIAPPGGFPIVYYPDDETALLFTDTARRLGGLKHHVILAGLRPGPAGRWDQASWTRAVDKAAGIVARAHPGTDRCSVLFQDAADQASIAPSASAALTVDAYATLLAHPGQSSWVVQFRSPPDRVERRAEVQLHSDDRLLAVPEAFVRVLEWASTCRRQ